MQAWYLISNKSEILVELRDSLKRNVSINNVGSASY